MSLTSVEVDSVPGRADCEACPDGARRPAAVVVTLLHHRGWATTFRKHLVCLQHAFTDLGALTRTGHSALFEPVDDDD